MKFIVGIVSYNPDIVELSNCVNLVTEFGCEVIIVDNFSENIVDINGLIHNKKCCHLIRNKENLGIAKALNQIFDFANELGYDWVLTLDQDSHLDDDILSKYAGCDDDKKVGIYCPRVHDLISDVIWPGDSVSEIDKCITSGSLTSVQSWKDVSGFDEYLFIDEVDNDFCYRLKNAGYKLSIISGAILNHKVGKTRVVYFLGKKIFVRNHSAIRKFYITRNRLYLDKKYHGHIKVSTIIKTVLFMVKTICFENDKINKAKACYDGIREAFKVDVH